MSDNPQFKWAAVSSARQMASFAITIFLAISFSAFVLFRPTESSATRAAGRQRIQLSPPIHRGYPVRTRNIHPEKRTPGEPADPHGHDDIRARQRNATAHSANQIASERQQSNKDLWCTYDSRSAAMTVRDLPLEFCKRVVHCCLTLLSPNTQPGHLYDFHSFLRLRYSPKHKPHLFIGLGGPHQEPGVFDVLDTKSTLKVARHITLFVASNRLDGLLFYITTGGNVVFEIFRTLHGALTSRGLVAAVTLPWNEPISRYIDGNFLPIIQLPPVLSRRGKVGCPAEINPKSFGHAKGSVMRSVRFTGVKYRLQSAETAYEDAPGTLAGRATYADVCTAIRSEGWTGVAARGGDCIMAHNGTEWIASLSPWSMSLVKAANARSGVVILDIEMDDVRGACGTDFSLTKVMHSLL
ncbi:uncharacterized protein LOC135397638 isoform X2 [Ornithodoros turicata]|uniref:uncharacterized protein LOC135397638 isoform X2 n=1 Tax=Ornithodoros turicata TaxID=34597 RepID=UPI003139C3BE